MFSLFSFCLKCNGFADCFWMVQVRLCAVFDLGFFEFLSSQTFILTPSKHLIVAVNSIKDHLICWCHNLRFAIVPDEKKEKNWRCICFEKGFWSLIFETAPSLNIQFSRFKPILLVLLTNNIIYSQRIDTRTQNYKTFEVDRPKAQF